MRVSWCQFDVTSIPGVARKDFNKELGFNVYVADWLRKQFELTGEERFSHWHHSANERSSVREGFNAKMMGQARGMPDLVHFGLRVAVELKVGDGVAGKYQVSWLEYLRSIGWHGEVVRSFERFREIVEGRR